MATANQRSAEQHFNIASGRDRCDKAQGSTKECICVKIQGDIFQVSAPSSEKKKRPVVVQSFLKVVNALFNEGGGVICLHPKQQNLDFLGDFTEQVDDKVNCMLFNGPLFDDKIKLVIGSCAGGHCLTYSVTGTKSELPYFLNYNTKVSLDKGLADLSPKQFTTLFYKSKATSPRTLKTQRRASSTHTFQFIEGREVASECPFKETRNQQAKSVPKHCTTDAKKLTTYMWEHLKTPQFISAFTKNDKGGSVFFGLTEEKKKKAKWHLEDSGATPICIENLDWKVWRDSDSTSFLVSSLPKPPTTPSSWILVENRAAFQGIFRLEDGGQWTVYKDDGVGAFHVARESDVPTLEQKTGRIVCEGLEDVKRFQEDITKTLCEKIKSELLWLGTAPPVNPVTLTFHPVVTETGQETRKWVIEMIVERFHGIVFTERAGPELYRLNRTQGVQSATDVDGLVKRLPTEKWLPAQLDSEMAKLFKAQSPIFQNP